MKVLSPKMAALESLSLVFPWHDYDYPPYLAGVGKKITGVVEDLVVQCKRLEYLRCQDSELSLDVLDTLQSLDTLYITVSNAHTVDDWLKREQRLQVRQLELDMRGPPKPDKVEIQRYLNAWTGQGIEIYIWPPIAADQIAMHQFDTFLPDPIVG